MSPDDWFRNTVWNPDIELEFLTRLGRARSSRDQYLAIQAQELAPHEPQVALRLVDQYFKTRTDKFHDLTALLAKAKSYVAMNEFPKAVEAYKAALEREVEFPNVSAKTCITLPYFIAKNRLRDEYDFALNLLDESSVDTPLPIHQFMWQASCAIILQDQGLAKEASKHAKLAITVANIRKSGLRYHQDLGLVGQGENDVVKLMWSLGA